MTAWAALEKHKAAIADRRISDLFTEDEDRTSRFAKSACGIWLDFSKNLMTEETLTLLTDLARAADVESRRADMMSGKRINVTEDRAVLHTALRRTDSAPVEVDGKNVIPDVEAVLAQMDAFVDSVHSGKWSGYTGETITDVVNLGIGGSDLGPRMVCHALKPYYRDGIRPHFVSNVDGTAMADVLKELDPARTLFIIASKSFTTQETMANAHSARAWFVDKTGEEAAIAKHFVAVSTNLDAVSAFGILPENAFAFWDWVGGRYSVMSSIGLSVALTVGMENFNKLRQGAFEMDRHFEEAPFEDNLPVLLALIGIWNANILGHRSFAMLPYGERLALLPAYFQQADMESNGKRVTRDGKDVATETAPVLWGGTGTDAQHSFFQMLHQGTQIVPADFLALAKPDHELETHHRLLMANVFAQTEALMRGRNEAEAKARLEKQGKSADKVKALTPHTVFTGNRPTNTLLIDQLTPERLGALIALYEHKIFVQGAIWDINSYDQWGVELGKELASQLLSGEDERKSLSPSTHHLVDLYNSLCRPADKL